MKVWNDVVPKKVKVQCPQIEKSIQFTKEKTAQIKKKFEPFLREDITLVLAGSIGRKESHESSDVDAFFLFEENILKADGEKIEDTLIERLKHIVESQEVGLRMASKGAFSNACWTNELYRNIGGRNDTNETLTKRILLLIKGYGIPKESFVVIRKNILTKYLADLQPASDRRPVFLLNDVIRYYRTMCVDYEYKKNEEAKPWAVRLIKLRHSRKLIYFSALLPLIESTEMTDMDNRIGWLNEQFTKCSPIERIILLLEKYGQGNYWDILTLYNKFLEFNASKNEREKLNEINFNDRLYNSLYVELRDNAREFRNKFVDFLQSVSHWKKPINNYLLS